MRTSGLIVTLLTIACLCLSFNFFKKQPRDYADIAREIRENVGKKLSKKHQMDLVGVGGGMMGSVYMLGLSFQIHHPMDRNEARERIVDCVEELLASVNSNQEIRPFLKNYPFTTQNVQIVIFSNYPNGKDAFDPYISTTSVYTSDTICFSTTEPNNKSYKNRHKEPYSEALSMLKSKMKLEKQL